MTYNIMFTEKQKKMIEIHKEHMYNMRFFGLEWQATHQRRWENNSPCWEGKCECEKVKE